MIEVIEFCLDRFQRSDNLVIIHSLGADDSDRSLHSVAQIVHCGDYAAILHALYFVLAADVNLDSGLFGNTVRLDDVSEYIFFFEC